MGDSTKSHILTKSSDWNHWLFLVKGRAQNTDIWGLVDPSLTTKPEGTPKPTKPTIEGTVTADKKLTYDYEMSNYRADYTLYEKQQKALADLATYIQDSIATNLLPYISNTDSDNHPWTYLTTLKAKLAPTNEATDLELEQQYNQLKRGPANQNIERWLQSWEEVYTKAKQRDLPQVKDDRPVRDFLLSLRGIDSTYSQMELHILRGQTDKPSLHKAVEDYRQHLRIENLEKPSKSSKHSAFPAIFKGKEQENTDKPPCICGLNHWYKECFYLNEDIRPKHWKLNKAAQAHVNEKLKDPKIKAKVDYALNRERERQPGFQSTTTANSQSKFPSIEVASFSVISHSTRRANTSLQSSWILDSGTDHHICNSFMQDRFTQTRAAEPDEYLTCGETTAPITAYGTVTVKVKTPSGKGHITLQDVAMSPSFMANLISLDKALEGGIDWNPRTGTLSKNDNTICFTERHNGHFYLERNVATLQAHSSLIASQPTAFATKAAQITNWHQILGHASQETLQHLEESTKGTSITPSDQPLQHCETCALSKAHRLISRSPDKEEEPSQPFSRVTFDLLQLTPAYNGDRWTAHLACSSSNFILPFTYRHKSDTAELAIYGLKIIKIRYQGKVIFFRTDGETTLGNIFLTYLMDHGITLETSAPATPEQNGHSERSGGVLLTKARAMRIGANLPERLWPETIRAAAYIYNRTPLKKLGWTTPFGKVTGNKPNLSHLKAYGCKAYSLRKDIPRTHKLAERAFIGYLVGYDSTNIFRIWIPSQDKVIRTRDVTFDETSFYDPTETDIGKILGKEVIETLNTPNLPSIYGLMPQEESESSSHYEGTNDAQTTIQSQAEKDSSTRQLPTPSESVEPQIQALVPQEAVEQQEQTQEQTKQRLGPLLPAQYDTPPQPGAAPGNRAPRGADIAADITEETIIPEKSSRSSRNQNPNYSNDPLKKPRKPRKEAYAATLAQTQEYPKLTFYNAFSAAINTPKPKTNLHRDNLPPEPKNFEELLNHPLKDGFLTALFEEIKKLEQIQTWIKVSATQAHAAKKQILPLTWVFKYKFDEEGYLTKFKARLCVRGDLQSTAQDTYAATLAARIFRGLMAIMAAFDLESRQYDVINAYPHVPIDEETYCKPPPGMKIKDGLVLLLLRALYGLKQSPALWQKHLSTTLQNLGLIEVPEAPCLFTNEHMILFFFVDDIVVIYHKDQTAHVDGLQRKLFEIYEMRYLGEIQWFLAIRIIRNRDERKLWLCQDSYISKLTAKFNVKEDSKRSVPLPPDEPITQNPEQATEQDIYVFQQKVGSINYAAVHTRPDIAHTASRLSEHLQNPSAQHLHLAQRVLEYLASTRNYALTFSGFTQSTKDLFIASSDASFASDIDTRKSIQGFLFRLFGGAIDWKAAKQRTVTTSSTEAELLALSATAKETIWWENLFKAIDFSTGHQTKIQCDNTQTIRLLDEETYKLITKLRHVQIHSHWLRQEVQEGNISIYWTPTAETIADGLTKPLNKQKHQYFLQQIGLEDITTKLKDN